MPLMAYNYVDDMVVSSDILMVISAINREMYARMQDWIDLGQFESSKFIFRSISNGYILTYTLTLILTISITLQLIPNSECVRI